MKRMFFLMTVTAFILTACHPKTPAPKNPVPPDESKNIALKITQLASNTDFVCGMPLREGSIGDTASFDGKIYGFCSTECKTEFLKDPSIYLSHK